MSSYQFSHPFVPRPSRFAPMPDYNRTHPYAMESKADEEETREWCYEKFGPGSPKHRWVMQGTKVWFKSEDDAFHFKMRFG